LSENSSSASDDSFDSDDERLLEDLSEREVDLIKRHRLHSEDRELKDGFVEEDIVERSAEEEEGEGNSDADDDGESDADCGLGDESARNFGGEDEDDGSEDEGGDGRRDLQFEGEENSNADDDRGGGFGDEDGSFRSSEQTSIGGLKKHRRIV
jgi:hypothetical protein